MSLEGEFNDYATHLPVLAAACGATDGPILEAGCGHNSTVFLHALCAPREREMLTLDGDAGWLDRFRDLETAYHRLRHVDDWANPPLGGGPYDVAFIDHGGAVRGELVDIVRPISRLVVMHDSECWYCGYTEPLKRFDWVWTLKRYATWTSIAGMGLPPVWLEHALSPGSFGIPGPYRG